MKLTRQLDKKRMSWWQAQHRPSFLSWVGYTHLISIMTSYKRMRHQFSCWCPLIYLIDSLILKHSDLEVVTLLDNGLTPVRTPTSTRSTHPHAAHTHTRTHARARALRHTQINVILHWLRNKLTSGLVLDFFRFPSNTETFPTVILGAWKCPAT